MAAERITRVYQFSNEGAVEKSGITAGEGRCILHLCRNKTYYYLWDPPTSQAYCKNFWESSFFQKVPVNVTAAGRIKRFSGSVAIFKHFQYCPSKALRIASIITNYFVPVGFSSGSDSGGSPMRRHFINICVYRCIEPVHRVWRELREFIYKHFAQTVWPLYRLCGR